MVRRNQGLLRALHVQATPASPPVPPTLQALPGFGELSTAPSFSGSRPEEIAGDGGMTSLDSTLYVEQLLTARPRRTCKQLAIYTGMGSQRPLGQQTPAGAAAAAPPATPATPSSAPRPLLAFGGPAARAFPASCEPTPPNAAGLGLEAREEICGPMESEIILAATLSEHLKLAEWMWRRRALRRAMLGWKQVRAEAQQRRTLVAFREVNLIAEERAHIAQVFAAVQHWSLRHVLRHFDGWRLATVHRSVPPLDSAPATAALLRWMLVALPDAGAKYVPPALMARALAGPLRASLLRRPTPFIANLHALERALHMVDVARHRAAFRLWRQRASLLESVRDLGRLVRLRWVLRQWRDSVARNQRLVLQLCLRRRCAPRTYTRVVFRRWRSQVRRSRQTVSQAGHRLLGAAQQLRLVLSKWGRVASRQRRERQRGMRAHAWFASRALLRALARWRHRAARRRQARELEEARAVRAEQLSNATRRLRAVDVRRRPLMSLEHVADRVMVSHRLRRWRNNAVVLRRARRLSAGLQRTAVLHRLRQCLRRWRWQRGNDSRLLRLFLHAQAVAKLRKARAAVLRWRAHTERVRRHAHMLQWASTWREQQHAQAAIAQWQAYNQRQRALRQCFAVAHERHMLALQRMSFDALAATLGKRINQVAQARRVMLLRRAHGALRTWQSRVRLTTEWKEMAAAADHAAGRWRGRIGFKRLRQWRLVRLRALAAVESGRRARQRGAWQVAHAVLRGWAAHCRSLKKRRCAAEALRAERQHAVQRHVFSLLESKWTQRRARRQAVVAARRRLLRRAACLGIARWRKRTRASKRAALVVTKVLRCGYSHAAHGGHEG